MMLLLLLLLLLAIDTATDGRAITIRLLRILTTTHGRRFHNNVRMRLARITAISGKCRYWLHFVTVTDGDSGRSGAAILVAWVSSAFHAHTTILLLPCAIRSHNRH
uniref:Putative secreted protein n=1 Tax=Anopheles triannulatus TaxID=58253 RepID=A0A2M4B0L2_9DIPT